MSEHNIDVKKHGFGAIPSLPDIRDYTLCQSAVSGSKLPETYINSPIKIKSQGTQPTCVAFALSSLVEFHTFKDTKVYTRFSTNCIYGCRFDTNYFGNGMYLRDGLKIIRKYGDVEYSLLPGNASVSTAYKKVKAKFKELKPQAYPNRISTYYKINTINELKYALYNDGPVVASMYWFDSGKLDKNAVYQYDPSDESKSGHAILILGWDKDNLIIQNSWGKTFGKNGLFYIPISKRKEVLIEMYGVTDHITNIKQPSKVKDLFSPILNQILRWLKH